MDNKLIKALELLKLLTDEELELLKVSIKSLSMRKREPRYYFDIDLIAPLSVELFDKIKSFSFNGIYIYVEVNSTQQLGIDHIKSYLSHFANTLKQAKHFKNIINNNHFEYDDNILTINYHVDVEKKEIYKYEEEIKLLFRQCFGIRDIAIRYVLDEFFINKTNETQIKKQQEISAKLASLKENINQQEVVSKIKIEGKIQQLKGLMDGQVNVNISGEIFNIEITESTKAKTYRFYLDDYENTFCIKHTIFKESEFSKKNAVSEKTVQQFKEGDWIVATVDVKTDKYEKEPYGQIKKIKLMQKPQKFERTDTLETRRIELMTHTKMSSFDGINDVENIFKLANEMNMPSIGFCDRYNIQSFPEIQKFSAKYNVKPIYGCEMEVLPNFCKSVINETTNPISNSEYVIFDLETTGLIPEFDDIIEFGAIKTDGVNLIDRIQFFIKPNKPINETTTALTNITQDMVDNAISQEEGIKKILHWIGGANLIAHNAINFDFCFLQKKAEKYLNFEIKNTVIDTLQIARSIFPNWKSHRLQKLCEEFDVNYSQDEAHRADYDANVLFLCWTRIIDILKQEKIFTIADINKLSSESLLSKYINDLMVVYCKNNNSLRDLNEIVSYSFTKYFHSRPMIVKNILEMKRTNFIIANDPYEGEILRIALNGTEKDLKKAIAFYDFIFVAAPSDFKHLINTKEATLKDLENVTKKIINLAVLQNKKVIAVSNSFYLKPWEKKFQYVYLYAKGLGGQRHRYFRYGELPDTFIKTTKEMKEAFSFLNDQKLIEEIVVTNSHFFNDEIAGDVKPIKDQLFTPKMDSVDEMIESKVYESAHAKYGPNLPEIVNARIKKELNSIINNNFSVIYWISHLLVKKSLSDGYVVGSRGSVGSSLVATMLNITDVNPLPPHYVCPKCFYFELVNDIDDGFDLQLKQCPKCNSDLIGDGHNIPFETFLGFKGDKVPDIDLNFSGLYQATAHNFIKEMFGEERAFRAGTISTIATKTCYGYVKSYFDDIKYFDATKTDLNLYVKKCQDVKRTTGQHPGGILIVPKEYSIFDFSPYNYPADVKGDWYTTHYAFEYLHDNLLKFDILGHDNPTILKKLKDLTNVDEKDIPNHDENVMKLFTSTEPLNIIDNDYNYEKNGAISIPEFGTKFVREMLVDTKPSTFADLIRISGLSHGTDVYIGNAKSLIKNKNLKLKNVIACRDDVLNYLINQGLDNSTAFKIMEDVRKGKGLKTEYIEVMKAKNVPEWYIDSCQKIKYIFPKAHATAYVMHAWKFAWYKIYYPLPYYAIYFSTKPDVFDIETIIKGKQAVIKKRDDILSRLSDKNQADSVKKKETDLLSIFEVVLEMFARGYSIEKPSIALSMANDFVIFNNKIIAPFSSVDGVGEEVAMSIVEARDKMPFVSIDDVIRRTKLNKTNIETLERIGVFESLPKNDQMKLFDI